LFRLIFEPHNGRAAVPIPKRKREPASDINTPVVDGLKVLDPKRPIREADAILAPGFVGVRWLVE
jgi:hypothetical protein